MHLGYLCSIYNMDPSINNESAPHSHWGPFHNPCPTTRHLHRGVNHARRQPAWPGISLGFSDSHLKTPQHLGLDELRIEPASARSVPIVTSSLSHLCWLLSCCTLTAGECPHTGTTFWVSRTQWHKTEETASHWMAMGLGTFRLKKQLWSSNGETVDEKSTAGL